MIRRDDPLQLARYIWAVVHGVAMLVIDGQLPPTAVPDDLAAFAMHRIRDGIGAL